MSDRGTLEIPFDTRTSQSRASDPDYSIWVEANAGSGKTYVLTHRVLRLLLAGTRPQSILCLTYTKAAAAEMRKRVGARLAQWALATDSDLYNDLRSLIGSAPGPETLRDARTLFARALETPGGLRILTIHAFCEAVLHRFPIEAGVPFDFAVIEDEQQVQMVLSARESVLAEGLRGGAHAEAVETLFGLMSDDAITKAINSALSEGARLKPLLNDISAAKQRLRQLIRVADSVETLRSNVLADTLLTSGAIREIVACLEGNPEGNSRCVDLLARLDPDNPTVEGLRAAFFTGKGEARSRLMVKKEVETWPGLHDLLIAEQERLVELDGQLNAALLVARSEAVLDVVAAIRARYEDEKRRHALLDFDDLIEKLGDLFDDAAIAPWVQYKLDAGIEHILVDESQDTNERQWRVVKALAAEFFTGEGAVDRPRSIFAVGDQKQSIYSFQGAQPVLFGETGLDMARQAKAANKPFARVPLHTSFRTLGTILDAVDRVTDREDIRAALLSVEKVIHQAARVQQGGSVTLWPPVQEEKSGRDTDQWPKEPVEAEQSAARQVALRMAREIRDWIDNGRVLGQRGRAIVADDVLILVQKRGAFFQEIIRALRAENLPTPGADRLALTGHIAVLDLLALIDVLLNPADDLQLAALLRSPLFDVSEDDLYHLAHGRADGQGLWAALLESDLPPAREAAENLVRWRGQLDLERPFEFLAFLLYAEGGLRRFHARLGNEVDEVLSELLELALAHEQGSQPSLQGFAVEMRRRSVSIKRELAESGGGVRVMTVHGAKGLEAPIVILADATAKPSAQMTGKPVYVLDAAPGPLLVHASAKGQHVEATLPIKEAADAALAEEYWRRLYVAMTRAEDELYVTGTLSAAAKPETQLEGSWYQAVEQALAPDLVPVEDADGLVSALVFGGSAETAVPSPPSPMRGGIEGGGAEISLELGISDTLRHPHPGPPLKGEGGQEPMGSPQLAAPESTFLPFTPAPMPEQPGTKLVSPSRAGLESAPEPILQSLAEQARDAEGASKEGLALHALLQHLGRVERKDWERVAPRALETLLPDQPARHESVAAKAISILARPELARLFGPDSRAELPFLLPALRAGARVRLQGRMDRLVVDDSGVLVVDYKSDALVPDRPEAVKPSYLTQLGLYALVAGQLFPGRAVSAAILWTERETLMNLPPALLEQARADFTLR